MVGREGVGDDGRVLGRRDGRARVGELDPDLARGIRRRRSGTRAAAMATAREGRGGDWRARMGPREVRRARMGPRKMTKQG
uniref:Uncharacterized protein n=1 Tax=Oryza brachyantha TaxID=4533 RepID=J3ND56_ORYBR